MPPSNITDILWWNFLGGDEITLSGANINASLPGPLAGLIVEIDNAGTEDLRYEINGTATAHSHGYVPSGGARIIGPLQNWVSLGLYGAAGAVACLTFFRPNTRQ